MPVRWCPDACTFIGRTVRSFRRLGGKRAEKSQRLRKPKQLDFRRWSRAISAGRCCLENRRADGCFRSAAAASPHHAVVTMTNGCAWRAGSDGMPPLAIFRGKRVVVSGDADVPGQTGADSFAADVATVADSVFVCQLPYSIQPDHGKDLRDWCCEDDWTWSHLKELLIDWESLLDFRQTVLAKRVGFRLSERFPEWI